MKTIGQEVSLPARRPLAQAIALTLTCGAGGVQAAVFSVTANADSGLGSLRQAVLNANASPGADQITFDVDLGAIALTSGQIDITETLTITGPAAGQVIDAGGNSRIFGVTVIDQPLTLENLTLTGGYTADGGGGVWTMGDLTLTNSTISGNRPRKAPRLGSRQGFSRLHLGAGLVSQDRHACIWGQ